MADTTSTRSRTSRYSRTTPKRRSKVLVHSRALFYLRSEIDKIPRKRYFASLFSNSFNLTREEIFNVWAFLVLYLRRYDDDDRRRDTVNDGDSSSSFVSCIFRSQLRLLWCTFLGECTAIIQIREGGGRSNSC